jgi:hypothetical protein
MRGPNVVHWKEREEMEKGDVMKTPDNTRERGASVGRTLQKKKKKGTRNKKIFRSPPNPAGEI